jgi:hypothetical protein
MDIMSVLEGAPPRKQTQKPTTELAPELAEPSPSIRPGPTAKPPDAAMGGFRIPVPIRPMARRFAAADDGLPAAPPQAPAAGGAGSNGVGAAASSGSASSAPVGAAAAAASHRSAVGSHPPPVRPPTMGSAEQTGILPAATGAQGFGPPPNPTSTVQVNSEGAMVGLLLDFWTGPATRDPARPVTPPLEELESKLQPSKAGMPGLSGVRGCDVRDTPRRGPKSMAKLKNSRCTVRPERQRVSRGEEVEEVGPEKRARTDKLALGAIYAQLYERVPFTDACEQTLARIFSDKELRVLMGMNKMTINNFNPDTKKYTEKTKQDKIRELIPMIKDAALVLPEEQPRFPAARLRRTDNPAARRSATEGGFKNGKRRRPPMSDATSSGVGADDDAAGSHGSTAARSHKRKRHRASSVAVQGKTTALLLGKRPTVSDELSEQFRNVSLDKLEEQQLVEVRSANGRSWIKALITGIEHPPLNDDGQPMIPPVVSVRCTVPRKRREDGRPHVVQWRGCAQIPPETVIFKDVPSRSSRQVAIPGPRLSNDAASGVVVGLPTTAAPSNRGRRERKIPLRYRGVEWTDMANILLAGSGSDSDDRLSASDTEDESASGDDEVPGGRRRRRRRRRRQRREGPAPAPPAAGEAAAGEAAAGEVAAVGEVAAGEAASAGAGGEQPYVEEEEEEEEELEESWRIRQHYFKEQLAQEQHRQQQLRQRQEEREERERQRRKHAEQQQQQQLLQQQQRQQQQQQRQRQRQRQRQAQPQPPPGHPAPGGALLQPTAGPLLPTLGGGPIRPAPMPLHPAIMPSETRARPEVAGSVDGNGRGGGGGGGSVASGMVQGSPGFRRQWQALPKTVVTSTPGPPGVQISPHPVL